MERFPFSPLAVLVIAFALAVPPLGGSQPNPSGSGVPVVAFDARANVTNDEARFGAGVYTDAAVVGGTAPVYDSTYDATWTNITFVAGSNGTGVSGTSTGLRLVNPNGLNVSNPRDLYSDGAHAGRYNVTFPSMLFNASGDWGLRDANGATIATFYVTPSLDMPTPSLSATVLTRGQATNFTATLRDTAGNLVPDGKVILRTFPDGNASSALGSVVTALNGTGAPGQGQGGNYTFALTPQQSGSFRAYAVFRSGEGHDRASVASFVVTDATPTFSIGTIHGSILAPAIAPIHVSNVVDLGTATVTLTLNTSVVTVANVTNGDIPSAQTTWAFNNSTSTLTILVTTNTTPGASGNFIFANVSLRAVGPAGSNSTLHLGVTEAVHANASAIATTTQDGTFFAGILGDANGDGTIDQNDVIAIASYVVGTPPPGVFIAASADVTHDGVVTGADAMFVRQYLAGTRSSL